MPNVGKSSLINSLKRSKACNVGATPGKYTTFLLNYHLVINQSNVSTVLILMELPNQLCECRHNKEIHTQYEYLLVQNSNNI